MAYAHIYFLTVEQLVHSCLFCACWICVSLNASLLVMNKISDIFHIPFSTYHSCFYVHTITVTWFHGVESYNFWNWNRFTCFLNFAVSFISEVFVLFYFSVYILFFLCLVCIALFIYLHVIISLSCLHMISFCLAFHRVYFILVYFVLGFSVEVCLHCWYFICSVLFGMFACS